MLELENIIKFPTPLQEIFDPLFKEKNLKVWIKRDDLCHPVISGNKFRKLKYNLINTHKNKIVTFGGAYSNHLAALAEAAFYLKKEVLAIVRGEELNPNSSETLRLAHEKGMNFRFVNRTAYRNKEAFYEEYKNSHLIIPEGGTNKNALLGVSEMMDEILDKEKTIDYIMSPVGTGGTLAGIISNKNFLGKTLGVAVLKNADFLKNEIADLLGVSEIENTQLLTKYHFGGYAKHTKELLDFMDFFETKHEISIDQVYTGKMFYALYDLIKYDFFKEGEKIVCIHTGGLQGKIKRVC
jgi:1-aminocyclopropane-1-carboxylate deaminase